MAPPLDTVDQAETDGAPATFLALLCSFGMLARGVATHVENVETNACMEGSPAGLLAEAGRSLGQPAACFFQYAVRSLCSASSPWAELQLASPLRRPCSIASRWRRSGIASRSPPSPDRGACTLWFARTAQGSAESWPAHEPGCSHVHGHTVLYRTHERTRSPALDTGRHPCACNSHAVLTVCLSHILVSPSVYCAVHIRHICYLLMQS